MSAALAYEIPSEFQSSPAVVLEDTRDWAIDVKGPSSYKVKVRILLQDRRGFDLADQAFTYRSTDSELKRFEARTILPSGETITVPADMRTERTLYREGELEYRVVQFTFPAIEDGAVIEWEYELEREDWRFIRTWELQRDIPVIESSFATSWKKRSKYSYQIWEYSRMPSDEWCTRSELKEERGYYLRETSCRMVPGFKEEDWAPPEEETRLEMIFIIGYGHLAPHFRSWGMINRSWSEDIEEFLAEREKVVALAGTLTSAEQSEAMTVDRIYTYVQENIKIRPSTGGMIDIDGVAKSVDDVLERGGGPGDDVTLLTLALLQAAKIEVDPVVVVDRRDGKMAWKYPGYSQVDHLLLRVKTDGQTGFLDPGCRGCQAGIPNWMYMDSDENGIVLEARRSTPLKVTVDLVPAEYNSERRQEDVTLDQDGIARVEGKVNWYGLQDLYRRKSWRQLSESAKRQTMIRRLPGDIDEVSIDLTDSDDLSTNIGATYRYRRMDLATVAGDQILLSPTDFFTKRLRFAIDHDRQHAVTLRYPFAVRTANTFKLPEGWSVDKLPSKIRIEGPGMSFECLWSREEAAGGLGWTGLLLVETIEIAVEDYRALLQFIGSVKHVMRGGIALTQSEE
jgi:hypothetical protein